MKLGKKPARINAAVLKLADYFDHAAVSPYIPIDFGDEHLIASWPMQGNGTYNNAVWAGAAHETRLWARDAGKTVTISTENTLADYTIVDDFRADDPGADIGTDLQVAASYRRRIGILDSEGNRHRIGGYLALTPGDPAQLAAAVYVFGAVGVGLRLPGHAMDDFIHTRPWSPHQGIPKIVGGHYVPIVGRGGHGNFYAVSWGRIQQMDEGFYRRYCDEALCYFSPEFLTAGQAPPGVDRTRLLADLEAFTRR